MQIREFQAVVFAAGRGCRLPEVPGAPPKCLLPVGARPILWYSLNMLQRHGFQDAIVIVLDSDKSEIQTALEKHDLKIKIDYVTVPSDEDWGTGQSLRHIHDRIYTDVLIVSCDLITDAQLHGAFDLFRKHDASVVSMVFDNGPQEYIQVPGPKSKDKQERDLIGIDEETKRLVFQASASDFDESVELSQYFLRKHPVLKISSRLLDAHVYIFKKWIVNFLKENDFTTIKGELLPFIIKKQLSKPPVDDKNTSVAHYKVSNDVFKFATLKHFDDMIRKKSTYNDHKTGTKNCYNNDIIKCYTYVAPANSYGIRVNTLSSYCLANSKIIKKWDSITNNLPLVKLSPSSDIKSKQIDEDCIISDDCVISEKTSLRGSILGSNCTIENKVCLINCIVMNKVIIKEGCTLQDCLIYSDVTIESQCTLKACIVGPKFVLPSGTSSQQQIYSETSDNMITLG